MSQPREIDGVEILSLVDNTADLLLASTDIVRREAARLTDEAALMAGGQTRATLRAEHGFSALVTAKDGGAERSVLLDAGLSVDGVARALDLLQVDAGRIEAIVLSHGHYDHTGGLNVLAKRFGAQKPPIYAHPDVWSQRRVAYPGRRPAEMPTLSREAVERAGFEVRESTAPAVLLDGALLLTGQVERGSFEFGFPYHEAFRDGDWRPDEMILDDQALVANVRGKGLVVLTGCGHAGVVNIVNHARKVTGVERLYALLGGFHLSGAQYEPIVPLTVEALAALRPEVIAPMHCTGFAACRALAEALPGAFIQNAVGSRYTL